MNAPRSQESNMGKGDKRTTRGKIFRASYGKNRPSAAKATAARASRRSRSDPRNQWGSVRTDRAHAPASA